MWLITYRANKLNAPVWSMRVAAETALETEEVFAEGYGLGNYQEWLVLSIERVK